MSCFVVGDLAEQAFEPRRGVSNLFVEEVFVVEHGRELLAQIVIVGAQPVAQRGELGVIESVKATNDLYSPASGQVVEVNATLGSEPGVVNQDPYGKGWMIVIKLTNPSELERLVSATEYQALLSK